jgi:hypothetical protein
MASLSRAQKWDTLPAVSNENEKQLADLFKRLGADDPEGWAASQIREGIPQLHRFLFLRQAWRMVVSEDSGPAWIDNHVAAAERAPEAPFAGAGLALKALRARGATDAELSGLVRAMQAELLSGLCYLLEDPRFEDQEVENVAWGLFATNDEEDPTEPVFGLHESVLETDPTGREVRPR